MHAHRTATHFSYLDTQLIRLGGPNFAHLPVNRPVAEVSTNQRDGFSQHRIHQGLYGVRTQHLAVTCRFAGHRTRE